MTRLTPWFPADVKPVRVGVYEIHTNSWEAYYAYWSGQKWGCVADHPTAARWQDNAFLDGAFQRKIWRGFTEEQK